MTALDDPTAEVPLRRNRDFLLLWTGNWLQFFGSRMSAVSYPLLALAISGGSPRAAGFASTAAVLPYLVLQLPVGVLVDRWDRRRLMGWCAAGRCVVLASVVITLGLGVLDLALLVLLIAADVSFAIVSALAERASIRTIVPPNQLGAAMSQNEARGRVAGLIGGPVGVLLFAGGRWIPYLVAALGAAVAAVNVRFIRTDCRPQTDVVPKHFARDLVDGLTWVRRNAFLRAALSLMSVSTALLQVVTLALVIILVNEQGHDESSVALLLGISGCGGVVGALSARWWMDRVPFPGLLIGGFVGWAALIAAMSVVDSLVGLGLLFGAMNLIGAVFGVAAAVYQMTVTTKEMQGRVSAVGGLLTGLGASAGAFGSGFLLDHLGGPGAISVAATGMVVVALVATASPGIRGAQLAGPPTEKTVMSDGNEKE